MSGNPPFPTIDKNSEFYLGCKKKRDNGHELCQVCPFRAEIEKQEQLFNTTDSVSDNQ
jgi:hypothetical protein